MFTFPSLLRSLRIPFVLGTLVVPTVNPTNDKFDDYKSNTLFAAESRLQQKINDLLINYNNFDNFNAETINKYIDNSHIELWKKST